MIVFCNFLSAIGQLLGSIIQIYILVLVIRAVLSWVNPDPSNFIVQFLYGITDPVLSWARKKIPPIGMLDVSIILVIFGLYFLDAFLVRSLLDYATLCRNDALIP